FLVYHSVSLLLLVLLTHPAHSEIYTLSLHDALPICRASKDSENKRKTCKKREKFNIKLKSLLSLHHFRFVEDILIVIRTRLSCLDRKSTRLNSSHVSISYAVFCLKKKTMLKQHSCSI